MPERPAGARLAGELVSSFLNGLAQRHVAGERVTGNADAARGDVDVDPGDAGELADLSPDGISAVVAGHPGDSHVASGHDRHRSVRGGPLGWLNAGPGHQAARPGDAAAAR